MVTLTNYVNPPFNGELKMKEYLADFYLMWFNDYLTIDLLAEHQEMSVADCTTLIDLGRKYHEERASNG